MGARGVHSVLSLGAVAQLGERRLCTAEVRGSNPLGSTLTATAGVTPARVWRTWHGGGGVTGYDSRLTPTGVAARMTLAPLATSPAPRACSPWAPPQPFAAASSSRGRPYYGRADAPW